MIKKLQRKFIMIAMGSLLVVMVLLVGLINIFNIYNDEKQINKTIGFLAINQGRFPEMGRGEPHKMDPGTGFVMTEETRYITRFFIVNVNSDGSIQNTDIGHIKAVTSEAAQAYAKKVIDSGRTKGLMNIYRYAVIPQTNGSMLIFLDSSQQLDKEKQLFAISGIVSLTTLLLMFILISVFSRKAIKPILESMEKQKLFITDAGHEIKTPLAIISANADVLELTGGENEWITSIRNQTIRLDKLVKNLLMLSKMEEDNIKLSFAEFDLSEAVTRIASPFRTVAETSNKKFAMDIGQGLKLYGDEGSIEQLVSTLADNAMKYSNEEGLIKISLHSYKKGIKLEVYNTVNEIKPEHLDKLFDRFYRSDSSRSRETGGYGIGLSIAKSIAEAHHGRISVKSDDGKSICFTVVL